MEEEIKTEETKAKKGKGGPAAGRLATISKEELDAIRKKSCEARKANTIKRKQLKEELIYFLSQGDTQEKVSLALIQKAMKGDVRAFEILRDTIGERPKEVVEVENTTINIKIDGEDKSNS